MTQCEIEVNGVRFRVKNGSSIKNSKKSREIERIKIMYCIDWEYLIIFIDYFKKEEKELMNK